MANKERQISVNAIEKAAESEYREIKAIEWAGLTVTVKPNLTAEEARVFYNTVVESSFNDDAGYTPLAKLIAVRAAVVSLYTNIRLPADADKAYRILFWTSLYDEVVNMIDKSQLDYIMMAVDDAVSYLRDSNIAGVNKQIGALSDAMENMSQGMGDMFQGVTPEIMQKFILGIAEHGIDEEKIAREVVRAKYEEEESKSE